MAGGRDRPTRTSGLTGRDGSAVALRDRAAVGGRNGSAVTRNTWAPLGTGTACGSGPSLRNRAARGRSGKRIRTAVRNSATRRGTAWTGPAMLAGAAGRNGSAVLAGPTRRDRPAVLAGAAP